LLKTSNLKAKEECRKLESRLELLIIGFWCNVSYPSLKSRGFRVHGGPYPRHRRCSFGRLPPYAFELFSSKACHVSSCMDVSIMDGVTCRTLPRSNLQASLASPPDRQHRFFEEGYPRNWIGRLSTLAFGEGSAGQLGGSLGGKGKCWGCNRANTSGWEVYRPVMHNCIDLFWYGFFRKNPRWRLRVSKR
jgi:hypothetical protein